jgi:hypothetical protein
MQIFALAPRQDVRFRSKADISHCIAMSALGQKQTFAVQKAMSALPPIATLMGASPKKIGPPTEANSAGHALASEGRADAATNGYLPLSEPGPTRLLAVCRSIAVREMLSIWSVTSSLTANCSTPGGSALGIVLVAILVVSVLMSQLLKNLDARLLCRASC